MTLIPVRAGVPSHPSLSCASGIVRFADHDANLAAGVSLERTTA